MPAANGRNRSHEGLGPAPYEQSHASNEAHLLISLQRSQLLMPTIGKVAVAGGLRTVYGIFEEEGGCLKS